MCKDFVMPAGGEVSVTNYISVAGSSGTITSSIAASSDDAEEEGPDGTSPGAVHLTSTDLELVADLEPSSYGTQQVGLRFNNISAPPGATITNAYITFRAVAPDAPNTNSGATSLTIEGQAADNPGPSPARPMTSSVVRERQPRPAGARRPGQPAATTTRPIFQPLRRNWSTAPAGPAATAWSSSSRAAAHGRRSPGMIPVRTRRN